MPIDREKVRDLLTAIIAPLVERDGAELYLVRAEANEIVVHFAGTYAGCPGVGMVTKNIVTPILRTAMPDVNVTANSGLPVPKGAERCSPGSNGKKK